MSPSERRVILEGLLLTLTEGDSGKSAAVATARQVLGGENKPRMVLNAPRVTGHEITETISKIRAQLQEAEHKLKCPKCGTVNPASAAKCKNCGHDLTEARKGKFASLREGRGADGEGAARLGAARLPEQVDEAVLNADERKAPATIKRKGKDGKTKYKYPIPDKGHAKAALARINQSDLSDAEKAKVRAKAKAKLSEADTRADYPDKASCNLPHAKMAKRGKRICPNCKAKLTLEEAGYPGHESLDRSPKKNWVERAGQLPSPIQHMAKDIHEERGLPLDQAIPIAISQAKKLAAKGNQKYVRAVAEWEKLKAKNAAKKVTESADLEEFFSPQARLAAAAKRRAEAHGSIEKKADFAPDPSEGAQAVAGAVDRLVKTRSDHARVTHALSAAGSTPRGGASGRHPGVLSSVDDLVSAVDDAATGPHDYTHIKQALSRKSSRFGALTEATTTTKDDKQGDIKAPVKEPKDKPTDAKRDPKEKLESVGKRVMHLQNRLNEMGYDVTSDGKFGPKTAEAVKDFQRAAMVKDDGIVGPITTNALKQAPHGEHFRTANVEDIEQPHESPGEEAAETPGQEQRERDNEADAKGITNEQEKTGPGGGTPPGVVINIGDGQRKLREAVEARKQSTGRDFVRALARENYLRRQLEVADLEEWSPQSRAAALLARRQHHHAGIDPDVMHEYVGRRPGEFPGRHEPMEGERAHVRAENGQHVFGTMRGGHLVDDTGAHVRPEYGFRPRGVVDEAGYHKLTQDQERRAGASIERSRARRLREASVRGASRKVVEIHRLPNGTFAPKGKGTVLKPGDKVALPVGPKDKPTHTIEATVHSVQDGKAVAYQDKGTTEQGGTKAAAHVIQAQGVDTPKPSKNEYSDISKFGKGGSPGRGPTGKLRNFEAMSPVKLKQTIADLHEFGKDPEALAAINKVAQSKGVSVGEPKSAKPKAGEYGIAKGAGSEMAPNKGNLSLKDMPLGTTFEMNDGSQYKLHKSVNDPFYIVKPLDGGKAKPLHKMFAPPKVGPVAEGYDGKTMPGQSTGTAASAGTQADDLFGMLSKSVGIASKAKAEGAQPDFQAAKTAMAPAAPAVSPQQVALDAYVKAGGNDPNVIAILKKQLQESVELREDWATFDATRKSRGLGHALSRQFGVRGAGQGAVDPKEGFLADLSRLGRGHAMRVPLPEGHIDVHNVSGRGLLTQFQVAGGGHHVDPEMRRGTRTISGRGGTAQELAERVKHSVHADFAHTAHHTGRALSARPGQRVKLASLDGEKVGTIHRDSKGTFHAVDHEGKQSTHKSADAAVRDLKTRMRAGDAKFMEGADSRTDPLSHEGVVDRTSRAAEEFARDPSTVDVLKEKIEKYNPDGAPGDLSADKVAELAAKNPATATHFTGREGEPVGAADHARDVVTHVLHGPRSPGTGHAVAAHGPIHDVIHRVGPAAAHAAGHVAPHIHTLHHLSTLVTARIEKERENLRRLEEAGDSAGVMRARARIRTLREQQARAT